MASEATLKQYETVWGRLTSAVRSRGELATPRALAEEIGRRGLGLRSAKCYASAIRHRLADNPLAIAEFNRNWPAARPEHGRGRRPKVSVGTLVLGVLRKHGVEVERPRKYANHVCDLVEGVVRFGLRPGEWAGAEWLSDDQDVLVIENGKRAEQLMTRGPFAGRVWKRANGDFRFLRLTGSEEEKAHSRQVINRLSDHEQRTPWASSERYLQRELRRIVEAAVASGDLAPRYRKMTIYSARHQFAANAKGAASIGAGEVAALMGHISIFTAVRSYARRRSGGSRTLAVEPFPESVVAVENRVGGPTRLPPAPAASVSPQPQEPPLDSPVGSQYGSDRKPRIE